LFHGGIEQYIPARKGQKHALRVVREVLTHETKLTGRPEAGHTTRRVRWLPFGRRRAWWRQGRQSTSIAGAMEFLMSVTKRKAVCFVVSDFFDDGYVRSMQMAARKHDVIAVLITDPRELQLPKVGLVELLDPETGNLMRCDTSSAAFRRTYAESARSRIERLEYQFRSAKIDFIHIDATGSVVDPLARFFRMREKRRLR
jgi:YD repeat-containing protein